jgi:peptide/nickel transport system permease protein
MSAFLRGVRRGSRLPGARLGGLLVALTLLVAVASPLLAPHDPTHQQRDGLSDAGLPLPPGERAQYPLGTDGLGRDVLSRLVHGARISMIVGGLANSLAMLVGLTVGLVAGYSGGGIQALLMRVVDVIMSVPLLLLAIALAALLRPSLAIVIVVVAAVYWTGMARLVCGEVLTLRELDFVTAARALGASGSRVIVWHLLPNLAPVAVVFATLGIGTTIRVEATLSYLGVGVPPPAPTWGNMIFEGQAFFRAAPWLVLIPGVTVMVTVLGFNLLGEGLRDALDPLRRTRDAGVA